MSSFSTSSSSSSSPRAASSFIALLASSLQPSLISPEIAIAESAKSVRPIDEVQTNKFVLRTRQFTPAFLHNPYILSSYRVHFSPRLALSSIFRWHNETANVWTHGLPCVYFAVSMVVMMNEVIADMDPMNRAILFSNGDASTQSTIGELSSASSTNPPSTMIDVMVLMLFYASTLCCFFFSSLYHLMGCCSFDLHAQLYRCDLMGILSLIIGSYIPALYYAFRCRPHLQLIYSSIILLLSIMLVVIFQLPACAARRFHTIRVVAMVSCVAFAVLPTLHWVLFVRAIDFPLLPLADFLTPLVLMLALYAIGFAFYSSNVPERYSPGRFDLIGQSHNIWHSLIVAAACVWERQLVQMYHERHEAVC